MYDNNVGDDKSEDNIAQRCPPLPYEDAFTTK